MDVILAVIWFAVTAMTLACAGNVLMGWRHAHYRDPGDLNALALLTPIWMLVTLTLVLS